MALSFEELKTEILRLAGDFSHPRLGEPGFRLECGGHFGGKDRVFVSPNWDKSLVTPARSRLLLNQLKARLKDRLLCTLHYISTADAFVLIVQDPT